MPLATTADRADQASLSSDAPDFEDIISADDRGTMRERILQLTWQQFEGFVRYVFECAGYTVKPVGSDHVRHHVDLLLYEGSEAVGQPWAHVEVRRYRTAGIIRGAVVRFIGELDLGGMTRGYLVTTSTFASRADRGARGRRTRQADRPDRR